MKLGDTNANTLKPVEVTKIRPEIGAEVLKHVTKNSYGLPLTGPLGQIGPLKNFSLGTIRFPVGHDVDFLPLVSPADAVISGVQEAMEAPSMRSVAEAVSPLADLLGESHGIGHAAGTGLEILGAISTAPRAIEALKGSGPKNKVEISFALADLISQSAMCIADCAGWTHARAAAQGISWVVKLGDQLFLMSHKEACAMTAVPPTYAAVKRQDSNE
jgi:hypothetical protein